MAVLLSGAPPPNGVPSRFRAFALGPGERVEPLPGCCLGGIVEPPPIKTDSPEVWPLIIHDLRRDLLVAPEHETVRASLIAACEARDAFGRQKYGIGLQVENGRHPLRDARDEALDCMAYTRQNFERVRASGAPRSSVLAAWQLHLGACAIGAMITSALMKAEFAELNGRGV